MIENALVVLCALGAATFATAAAGWWAIPAGVAGFLTAAVWLQPDPVWTGTTIAFVSVLLLARPQTLAVAAVIAGCLGGLWASSLQDQGLPAAAAWGLSAAVPAASAWMTRVHEDFAPRHLREEAMLLIGGFGLLVAIGPDVLAGWRAATAMNLEPGSGYKGAFEVWVVLLAVVASLGGGVHSLWRRR